jgi:IPT/TIG domain
VRLGRYPRILHFLSIMFVLCLTGALSIAATEAPRLNLSLTKGSVGTEVTLTGTGFGPIHGSSTVTFNGSMGTPKYWSDTKIVVSVPHGASTGPVVVTVNGQASNGVLFTVTPP